jgi:UDP-glucose 4-epimerase
VATREGGWRSFISRITNLYGPGQDISKAQGLISVLVAGHVTGSPVSVYVSLDTLRDYVYEDDAAAVIVAGTARVADEPPGSTVVKVVGTMRTVSIGAILSELTRLNRRRGPIVLGQGPSRGQALDLRVRSEVWTDLDALVRTTLPEGLGRVFAAQLRSTALPDERAPSSAS